MQSEDGIRKRAKCPRDQSHEKRQFGMPYQGQKPVYGSGEKMMQP